MNIFKITLLFVLVACANTIYAKDYDLVCGPDEDGCPPYDYASCVCIPTTLEKAQQPHCLDVDNRRCLLASQVSCNADDLYKDQGTCLAVLLQSEPEPPCALKTHAFCLKHHIPFDPEYRTLAKYFPATRF